MDKRTFLIALDVFDSETAVTDVKALLRSDDEFPNWWNYLPGVFLVTTGLDADAITEKMRTVLRETSFLVIAVDPRDSQGWLPEKSWAWIKRREREAESELSLKPA